MVENKHVQIDQQQSQITNKLSTEQWQALIALHDDPYDLDSSEQNSNSNHFHHHTHSQEADPPSRTAVLTNSPAQYPQTSIVSIPLIQLQLTSNETPIFPPASSPPNDQEEGDTSLLRQPDTRAITREQLVGEVKGIYAGLVMVEKKCVEIDQQQSRTTNKVSTEQWQALITLHRTLLHEHHDFFLACQHPSASPALRRLATKYAMPARMWRHGIHLFLELLRHKLPDPLDHMLAFVYLAYSMMVLVMESVPSFLETWNECLRDLAEYRRVIEEADLWDRENRSGVARMWYNKAADKSTNIGRIQHHLAVLARPNIIQQLYYYCKALVSVVPFFDTRESVVLFFLPFFEETASRGHELGDTNFVKAYGTLFTNGGIEKHMEGSIRGLDRHSTRTSAKFCVPGAESVTSMTTTSLNVNDLLKYTDDVKRVVTRSQFDRVENHLCQHQSMGPSRKRPDGAGEDVRDTEDFPSGAKRQHNKPYWMRWRIEIDLQASFLSRLRLPTLCFALPLFIQPATADNIDRSLGVRRPLHEVTEASRMVEIRWWLIAAMSCCVLLGLVLWQAEFTPGGHRYHPNRTAQIASGLSILVLWVLMDAESFAPLQFFLQVTNIGNLTIFWRSVFPSRSRNMRIVTAILIPGFIIAAMLSLPPSSGQSRASTWFSQILYAFLWLVLSLLECILDPPKRNENQLPDEERGTSSAIEPGITSLGGHWAIEAGLESTVESGTGASEDRPENSLADEQE